MDIFSSQAGEIEKQIRLTRENGIKTIYNLFCYVYLDEECYLVFVSEKKIEQENDILVCKNFISRPLDSTRSLTSLCEIEDEETLELIYSSLEKSLLEAPMPPNETF